MLKPTTLTFLQLHTIILHVTRACHDTLSLHLVCAIVYAVHLILDITIIPVLESWSPGVLVGGEPVLPSLVVVDPGISENFLSAVSFPPDLIWQQILDASRVIVYTSAGQRCIQFHLSYMTHK